MSEEASSRGKLLHGLSIAVAEYESSNPQSKAHYLSASKYLPGGNTRSVLYTSPFPLVFSRGISNKLYSLDGREYLDFLGEYTAGIFGHSNEKIKAAIKDALDEGWSLGGVAPWEALLAKEICDRFGMRLCRFTNSGTEANLMALAVSKAITGRKKILVFAGAYHGSLLSFPSGAPSSLNAPYEYIIAPYNDMSYLEILAQNVELTTDLAAILVEQMQGAGGCHPGTNTFLVKLREIADTTGAILIFDEVMTSRLYPGGLQAKNGIKPDLTTLGKYLGGGASFGCFGGKGEIMGLFDQSIKRKDGKSFSHPGTFNNNVFTMRAGVMACSLLTDDVLNTLNHLGDQMKRNLNLLSEKYSVQEKMWWTGVGSLMTVHFGERLDVIDGKNYQREYASMTNENKGDLYWFWMVQEGIYLARRGFVALTIEHTEMDVQQFVKATEGFLEKWSNIVKA